MTHPKKKPKKGVKLLPGKLPMTKVLKLGQKKSKRTVLEEFRDFVERTCPHGRPWREEGDSHL